MGKRGVVPTLIAEAFHVNLAYDELVVEFEALSLGHDTAIFCHVGSPGEHQVLRALAKAGTGIDIAREATGTLTGHKAARIGTLTYDLIARTEIEHQFCALKGQVRTGRNGRPKILTDLDAERAVSGVKKEMCSHRDALSAEAQYGIAGHGR